MRDIVEKIFEENGIPFKDIVFEKNMNFIYFNSEMTHIVKFYQDFEKAALEKALESYFSKSESVPLPKVIKFGQHGDKYFVLRECISGLDMLKYTHLNGCDELLAFEAGAYLAKIHSKKFNKKGLITSKFTVDEYPIFSKEEFHGFLSVMRNRLGEETYSKLSMLDIDEYYEVSEYSMCHGDFAMKNILIDENEIKAILDFEWVSAAPPMDDIASFEFFLEVDGFERMIPAFRRGYKSVSSLPEMYLPNRQFYLMYKGLTMLATHFSQETGVFDEETEGKVMAFTLENIEIVL